MRTCLELRGVLFRSLPAWGVAERVHRVSVERAQPPPMREDQTVAADPGVVADDHGFRRVDERELQDDGATPQHEARLGELRPAHVDLLPDPRVLADLDRLAGDVAHDPDARVPPDFDPPALHHGEKTDLHEVPDLDDLPDNDAPEAEAHAAADAKAERPAIGANFHRPRH